MNPQKRFGQIEEVLAELLMKVDRIAKAVATSTVQNSKNFQEIKDQIAGIKSEFSEFKQTQQDILTLLKEKLG